MDLLKQHATGGGRSSSLVVVDDVSAEDPRFVIPSIIEEQRSSSPYPTPPSAASFAGSPSPPQSPKMDLLSPRRLPHSSAYAIPTMTSPLPLPFASPSVSFQSSSLPLSSPTSASCRSSPLPSTSSSTRLKTSTDLSKDQLTISTSTSSSEKSPKLKGILKPPTPCPSPSPSFQMSSPSRAKRGSLLSLAKENALNFFVPMRRLTARERRLQMAPRWWEENVTEHKFDSSKRVVTFEIDKCTNPSKLLSMRRRNSLLGILPRSPSDLDLAARKDGCQGKSVQARELGRSLSQEEAAVAAEAEREKERERRETVLPSQQLRRWRKLGRVVGVAMGMREISTSTKCASDPELDFQTDAALDDDEMLLPADIAASAESLSLRSLDTDLLGINAAAAAYHHRQRVDRRDSDALSDSALHTGITFRMGDELIATRTNTATQATNSKVLILPEVAITSPIEEDESSIDSFSPQGQ